MGYKTGKNIKTTIFRLSKLGRDTFAPVLRWLSENLKKLAVFAGLKTAKSARYIGRKSISSSKKVHHHIAKRPHEHLMNRWEWYGQWHSWQWHPHIHYTTLGIYTLIVGGIVFSNVRFVFAADQTDTWNFATPSDFTIDSGVETSGTSARLKAQNYSTDGNTSALFHLDESSGTTADDASANNNDATTNNSPSWATGNLNNGLSLNGTTQNASATDSSSLSLTGSNSLEAWTKFSSSFSATSHSGQQGILDKGSYQLYYDNTSGKVVYELANPTPSWTQKGGPNIDAGDGSGVENSWDVNGKPIITSQVVMGSDIYVGLGSQTSDAEVWRCASCATSPSWTQVGGDGLNSSWADGTYEEVTSLATDGTTLYAGIGLTANDAEVWRCSSCGTTPSWGGSRIAGKGTNSTWNTSYETVSSMAISGTTLLVGVGNNAANEAEVWRCTSCDGGSLSWSKIGGDGVGSPVSWNTSYENVSSMVLIGSNLVVGLGTTAGDGEVWRCTTNCLSGTAGWSKIGGDGTGSGGQSWGSTYEQIISMTYSGSVLYVGTGTTPANEADVWRCGDVTTCSVTSGWTQVGGDALNSSWAASTYETVRSLVADGTTVYAGIGDTSGEAEVWKCTSCDGGSPAWSKIGEGGTGVPPQSWTTPYTQAQTLMLVGTKLFVGVSNTAQSSSAEMWTCDTSGTCNATTGWSRIAGNRVNKSWGYYNLQSAEVMTSGNGNLYVGTGNAVAGNAQVWQYSGSAWTMIGGQGINSSWAENTYENVTSIAYFNGKLYAGLGYTAGDAEVWEYNGSTWTQIGGTASGNWGTASYETIPAMAVWNGKLYAGLGNNAANEAEVWEYSSGTSWTKVGGDGVGSPISWNTSYETVNTLGVYNGNLIAGIGVSGGDAEVWSYNGTGWTKIGGDGSGSGGQSWVTTTFEEIESMAVYNNELYVGLGASAGDAEVWKCTASCTVTSGWTQVGGDTVNSSWADVTYERVRSMAVYNGKLYAGLGVTAAEGEIWEWDGSGWTQMGGDGDGWTTGNAIERVSSLAVFKGKLYAGLGDSANSDSMIWAYGNNGYLESAVTSQDTSWHHIAATYDGSTMKIYIDGTLNNSGAVSQTVLDNTKPLLIGSTYGSPRYDIGQGYFAGTLDEIRISNTARSSFTTKPYTADPQTVKLTNAVRTSGILAWDTFGSNETANGGTITYRLSDNGGTAWKYWNGSAWATSSSTSETNSVSVINSNIASFPVTFDGITWQAVLDGNGDQRVTLNEVSIGSNVDITAPSANASSILAYKVNGGSSLASNGWTNGASPYFTWTAGSDAGSGIKGYCLYLGTDTNGDPISTKGLLGTSPVSTGGNCQFLISSANLDLATSGYLSTALTTSSSPYYLNIKAIDNSGNVFSTSAQFQFRFDNTAPSNPGFISAPSGFINTKTANLTWPTSGGDAASDANSGLAGLQYKINSTSWYGDSHTGSGDISDLLTNDGSYTTVDPPDFSNINEGINTVYFRTWDQAGNVTTSYVSAALKVNTSGAPSEPQNLTATPSTNTTNSFSFDWDAPATYVGDINNLTYCYTVNATPNVSNCSFTSGGVTSLGAGPYATQPGANTMYVVAKDESNNINYASYATVNFTANTPSPGIPTNTDIVDVSIKTTSNWRLALTWEPPSYVGAGISSYKVYRSTDNSTFSFVGSSSSTTYIDAGLAQQIYYYRVKACDSTNNCGADSSTVSMLPTGKFTTAATLTSEPTVSNITTKKARITWTTDRGSDSKVAIGTSSGQYSPSEVGNSSQVTAHTIDLDNLAAGTTYYFKAKWTDEDGNTGTSQEFTFTTSPAPLMKEVTTLATTLSSATIQFTSKQATKVNIYYGLSESFGGLKSVNTSLTESTYTFSLDGLNDGAKYFYKLGAFDEEGNEYTGNIFSFTTPPRPKITNLRFQPVEGEPTSTQRITWETNVPTSSTITYGKTNSAGLEIQDSELLTEHEITIKDLEDDSEYFLLASGRDKDGNLSTSDKQVFKTALDTRPPKIKDISLEVSIKGTGAEARGQVIVSWITDEPSGSQVAYAEGSGATTFNNKSAADDKLTTEHLVIVSDLPTSKIYSVKPLSKDKAGNEGSGEVQDAIVGKASDSVLTIILNTLQSIFGF